MLLGVVVVGSGGMLQVGFPGVDKPAGGLSVIPSPRRGGMECYDRCGRSGSIRRGDSPPGVGVMTSTTRVRPR